MGNCCTRIKDESQEANNNKSQLSEQHKSRIITENSAIKNRKELQLQLSAYIASQLKQRDSTKNKHSQIHSYNPQMENCSKKEQKLQKEKDEQQQQFYNRIYEDKLIEIELNVKHFENFTGLLKLNEISQDYITQVNNFCSSIDFLLKCNIFIQSQTPQKLNALNFKYTQFLLKYFEFQEKQFRTSLRTNQLKTPEYSFQSYNKEAQTQATNEFLSPNLLPKLVFDNENISITYKSDQFSSQNESEEEEEEEKDNSINIDYTQNLNQLIQNEEQQNRKNSLKCLNEIINKSQEKQNKVNNQDQDAKIDNCKINSLNLLQQIDQHNQEQQNSFKQNIDKNQLVGQIMQCQTLEETHQVHHQIDKLALTQSFRIDNFDIIQFFCQAKKLKALLSGEIKESGNLDKKLLETKLQITEQILQKVIQKADQSQQQLVKEIKGEIYEKQGPFEQEFLKNIYEKLFTFLIQCDKTKSTLCDEDKTVQEDEEFTNKNNLDNIDSQLNKKEIKIFELD